ncbi:hypothetical protein ACSHUI_00245 [Bacillus subtilis]|uniref:hypothetical protein n=1 Tax=Bacillus subtilis TaxID=1423 RepID=UPI0025CA7F18|nr:hypothetical protein [Bacillus subtilis]WCS68102.1 hypothetical protein Goe26_01900 [Bacillus phage vB_BsuM-Goe26]GLI90460.1 hypothetical protein ANABIO4_38120 [Bacillus subtilis]
MLGKTTYLDKDRRHGVSLCNIDFTAKTVATGGGIFETKHEDVLEGEIEVQIARNTRMIDYKFFNKEKHLPYFEKRDIDVNNLPPHIQEKMFDLWKAIEEELGKTEVMFEDLGRQEYK